MTHDGPVLGKAVTRRGLTSQARLESLEDTLEVARAIRRALAVARRKAFEVDRLSLAAPHEIEEHTRSALARRALGAHGRDVHVTSLSAPGTAEGLVAAAALSLREEPGKPGLSVAVGLALDGTTEVSCIDPAARVDGPP